MSKNTFFNTRFWQDTYVANLDPSEKLLFVYCITCPALSLTGIYEIALKYIAVEIGFEKEMVQKMLNRFEKDKKIIYRDGWLCVVNYPKYQSFTGEKLSVAVTNEIKAIPKDILDVFIGLGYPMDTLSILPLDRDMDRDRDMVKERVKEKTPKPEKKAYGEFKNVFLTDDELTKLVEALNMQAVEGLIEQLSCYMESKGKRYKSHYATIQVWARKRIDDHVKEIKSKKNIIAF
ncbi:hypothetical protein A2Z56_02615 [Candidatus Kaiserbacteria bacterium RIFCSPHIGHO2_12_45_16]|nr:MAG: hypothetical protein A2Z56_02615 [Candidatus Kaiserbacteria bacterium RIFCSPHIGHO2_12_45_16]